MEPGKYRAKVVGACTGTSEEKGTPYVEIGFEVAGESINARLWLTEASAGMTRKSLKAVGFDIDKYEVSDLDAKPEMLMGNEAEIVVDFDDYMINKGREGAVKVKYVNSLSAKPKVAELKRLTQMLRQAKQQDEPTLIVPDEAVSNDPYGADPDEEKMNRLDRKK